MQNNTHRLHTYITHEQIGTMDTFTQTVHFKSTDQRDTAVPAASHSSVNQTVCAKPFGKVIYSTWGLAVS